MPDRHTPGQIYAELMTMLGTRPGVTVGQILVLACKGSPYITGEAPTPEQEREALEITGLSSGDAVREALEAARRPWECIRPADGESGRSRSEICEYSPEWLAETITGAARALPSLTMREIVWELPAVTVHHLILADFRRRGGATARPSDEEAAMRALKDLESQDGADTDIQDNGGRE